MATFKCEHESCGYEFEIHAFKVFYDSEGNRIYKDTKGHILCPKCTNPHIKFIEPKGEYRADFLSFNSMSMEDKKKMLKKRATKHHEKHVKERQHYLDNNFKGNTNNLTY
jgi:hypothetical protein